MPNKKQLAVPAEAGWLLEVGWIGIDKTLKLLKLTDRPLLELEQVLRHSSRLKRSDRLKMPWLEIPKATWEVNYQLPPPSLLGSWDNCLAIACRKKGRELTESEHDDLLYEYYEAQQDYAGRDEVDKLIMDLDYDEELKIRKGPGPTSLRKPLAQWRINEEALRLFEPGYVKSDTERKKLKRIREHSIALAFAIKESVSRRPSGLLGQSESINEIVTHSRIMLRNRRARLSVRIEKAEQSLRNHDVEGKRLRAYLQVLKEKQKQQEELRG